MISTIPYQFDVASYASVVKPYGFFTQVGMPENFQITLPSVASVENTASHGLVCRRGMRRNVLLV